MRDFRDAKAMAQTLREALKPKSVSLTHSESLELVAKILGFHDWNVLSASIQSEHQRPAAEPGTANAATALLPNPIGAGLPTVALRDIVLFPQMIVPLLMGRDASKRAVESAMAGDKRILAITQKRPADDSPRPDALYGVGVTASIIDRTRLADGTVRLTVKGLERAAVARLAEGQFLAAETVPIEETRGQETVALPLMRAVLEKLQACRNGGLPLPPYSVLPHIREPGMLADAVAPLLLIGIDRRQDLLETSDVVVRLEKILALIQTDQRAA
jgi:ATP-dependent Lon protease